MDTALATEIKSYAPVVYDNGAVVGVNEHDKAEEFIDELEETLISPMNLKFADEIEDKIMCMYFEAMRSAKGIPNIIDVLYLIDDYNNEIIYQIAEIDFANDITEDFTSMIGDDDVDVEETINENYACWQGNIHYEYNLESLPILVDNILMKHNMAYYETNDRLSGLLKAFGVNLSFVHNDCQNLLNPEWITEAVSYMDDDVNKTNLQVVTK